MPEFMDRSSVQLFLDSHMGREIAIVFAKADGTQSAIVGILDPSSKRVDNVPIRTEYGRGYKSFNVNRVYDLCGASEVPALVKRIKAMGKE